MIIFSVVPNASVLHTSTSPGKSDSKTKTVFLSFIILVPAFRASNRHVARSYMEELIASNPVSFASDDEYNQIEISDPWLLSGWYGVYAVESPLISATALTSGG